MNQTHWNYRANGRHFQFLNSVICVFVAQSSEIRRRLSSELAVLAAGVQALTSGNITPCSADTGYSEQRLDTPPSSMAGSSASSQGGGGTPYSSRSGTPFSQESGYTGGRSVVDIKLIERFLPTFYHCHADVTKTSSLSSTSSQSTCSWDFCSSYVA